MGVKRVRSGKAGRRTGEARERVFLVFSAVSDGPQGRVERFLVMPSLEVRDTEEFRERLRETGSLAEDVARRLREGMLEVWREDLADCRSHPFGEAPFGAYAGLLGLAKEALKVFEEWDVLRVAHFVEVMEGMGLSLYDVVSEEELEGLVREVRETGDGEVLDLGEHFRPCEREETEFALAA